MEKLCVDGSIWLCDIPYMEEIILCSCSISRGSDNRLSLIIAAFVSKFPRELFLSQAKSGQKGPPVTTVYPSLHAAMSRPLGELNKKTHPLYSIAR